MIRSSVCAFLLVSLLAASCSTSSLDRKSYDPRNATPQKQNVLTHEMAWLRARQIGKVAYTLWFGLDPSSESYDGRVVVHFDLRDLKKSLPKDVQSELKDAAQIIALDFEGGQIDSMTINGAPVNLTEKSSHFKSRYDGHRIYVHTSELLPVGNRIAISFTQKFRTDGTGFHRYKDPQDGNVYLYTQGEPYYIHEVFPCFDQPDLKASYELTVEAPPEWQIISNTLERDVSNVDGRKSWQFPPSPLFSTYLFEIAAGPYAMWKADHDGIPMRLFARQAMKEYVVPREWFDTTGKGLDFYSSYFGYPYPYAKYDQIIVPEFNSGAMENVSAITFSERAIYRSKPTVAQLRGRANIILHEMAHQWFGDLVTMRWWNGLWLNESFATFMSFKALAETTDFPNVDASSFGEKTWALWEDQLVTTHPIDVPMPDTDAAEANFDGITYGKGAAVLKQLHYYLGDDDFREGLQRYFLKYALRNTTLHEFIKMLSEGSGKDLTQWQKQWFQTSGVNGLRAEWSCDADGDISKFDLVQTPAAEGAPDLRVHKTKIALYDGKGNGSPKLRAKGVVEAIYQGARTPVSELIGQACPSFVFPNHEQLDYAKVELDPASLEVARKSVSRFDTVLMRKVLWHTLHEMVVDGKMRPQDFFDAFFAQGTSEKDADLLKWLTDTTMNLNPSSALLRYLPTAMQESTIPKLEAAAVKGLRAASAGSDLQRIWFNAFVSIAHSNDANQYATKLLSGEAKLNGFPIKQNERWDLISLIARTSPEVRLGEVKTLIDEELTHDSSDLGIRSALVARVKIPTADNKKKWLASFVAPLDGKTPQTDDGISLNAYRLRAMIPAYHSDLTSAYLPDDIDTYFKGIPKLKEFSSDNPYPNYFTEGLYPRLCDPTIVARTSSALESSSGLSAGVIRHLKIQKQEEQRCIRARAKAVETATSSGGSAPAANLMKQ